MRTHALLALTLLLSGNALAKDADGLFDKPASVAKIPLAPDPLNPQAKPTLSCFFFKAFAVKQIDLGEVGAQQLSVVPLPPGGAPYKCREANAEGEKVADAKDWSGYFKGVKGGYVFFDAADGINSGLGFAVFDASSGKKLFDDVSMDIHAIKLTPSGIAIGYRRAYAAGCSLFADAAGCWAKIKQDTGLTGTAPDCNAAYKRDLQKWKDRAKEIASSPTVIYYEAQTVLESGAAKTSPAAGKVTCAPAN
jgi:hypothetical protein